MNGRASIVSATAVATIALAGILTLGPTRGADDTLVIAIQGTPAAIDGEQALTSEGEMMMANVHGGDLFGYRVVKGTNGGPDTVDLKSTGDKGVVGLLAKSWEANPEGTVYTVKLREGMKSPYGNAVSAADYHWAWERRFAVKSVGKFMADVLGIDSPDSINVLDDHTVRLKLRGTSPIFFKLLAHEYYGGPFDSVEAKKHATPADPWAKDWLRTHSAGFGPYQVDHVTPGAESVLVANANWTGDPAVQFKRVILKAVPESSSRLALLKAGQIDIAWGLNERELQEVAKDSGLEVIRAHSNKQLYLGLVNNKSPFDNKKIRQAMAWATPYDDIVQKVYYKNARRMTSIVPDIYAGYVRSYNYQTDPARAKALLAEAGFPNGFDVTLAYNAAQKESEETSILVKSAWEQVGVRVTLQALPTAVFVEQKYGKKLQAFTENEQWPWSGDGGYASWVYLGNGERNYLNAVSFDNNEYNELLEKVMRMLDSPERQTILDRLQAIVADEVPWVQIAWFDWTVGAKKNLQGFLWTPDNQLRFAYLRR